MLDSPLNTALAMLRQMEATLVGLEQSRGYVVGGLGREMLEVLIEEMRHNLSEMKRKLVH